MMLAMIFGGACNVFFGGGSGKMFIQVRCWFCNGFFLIGCSPPKFGRNYEKLANIFQVVSIHVRVEEFAKG